jgi:hypothetical protein
MACPYCGGPTGSERFANPNQVAQMTGRSRSWVRARMEDNRLKTARIDGRDMVDLRSLYELLSYDTSSLDEQIDQAEREADRGVLGARSRAMELRELQIQRGRAAGDPDFEMLDNEGREILPPGQTRHIDAPAARPADSLLRRFGSEGTR